MAFDLTRLVLIDEECGNLKVVVDEGERSRNINQEKKPEKMSMSVTHAIGRNVFSIRIRNVANHLGKHDFVCK